MAIGLVLLGLGFAVLVVSCQGLGPGIKTGMGALILCYFLHTLASCSSLRLAYRMSIKMLRYASCHY